MLLAATTSDFIYRHTPALVGGLQGGISIPNFQIQPGLAFFVALAAAVMANIYVWAVGRSKKLYETETRSTWQRAVLGLAVGSVIGAASFSFPMIFGTSAFTLPKIADQAKSTAVVILVLYPLIKAIAVAGAAPPGGAGYFAPTQIVGAFTGAALTVLTGGNIGFGIVVGSACTLGAAAGIPIAASLLTLEWTGTLSPLAFIITLLAVLLTKALCPYGLYPAQTMGRPSWLLSFVINLRHRRRRHRKPLANS